MKSLIALVLLTASVAQAQQFNTPDYISTNGQGPSGATGPGVPLTTRVQGRIIAIGNPVVQNFPTGQVCAQVPQQVQQGSNINTGTILGAIVGGLALNRVGGGNGKMAATAIGTAAGAMVGNDMYHQGYGGSGQSQCQTTYEQRITGYSYVAQYDHIQVQGFMRRQPQIGEEVEIIIRSVFYAGS